MGFFFVGWWKRWCIALVLNRCSETFTDKAKEQIAASRSSPSEIVGKLTQTALGGAARSRMVLISTGVVFVLDAAT